MGGILLNKNPVFYFGSENIPIDIYFINMFFNKIEGQPKLNKYNQDKFEDPRDIQIRHGEENTSCQLFFM